MSPQTIRVIDAWLGGPLCWVLTVLRRLGDLIRRPHDDTVPPESILFIKLIELGANVQASAALRRAAEMVGRENVYFWVFEENRPILEILDLVPQQNVLAIRSDRLWVFALDTLRTLWKIRRLKIDAVVDMEFFARASAILTFLSGARRRVGMHRFTSAGPYRGDLMTHRVQHNPYTHVSMYFYLLVEALTTPRNELPIPKRHLPEVDLMPVRFQPTEAELQRVRDLLDGSIGRRAERPIVLINPNASDIVPLRKWPMQRFVEVGRRILAARPELTVVVTGSPSEGFAAEEFVAAMGSDRALSLAGKTTLRELIVLYCLSDVLITNDSGPGQFASMTDIHTVVLFGPETPQLWGPLGPRARALWAHLACSPCIQPFNFRFSPCKHPACMLDITVGQVVEAVDEVLDSRTPPTVDRR